MGIVGRVWGENAWSWDGSYGKRHIAEELTDYAKKIRKLKGQRYLFGVARTRVPPQTFAMGIVIVEQVAIADKLPKHYQPGETILVRGKVLIPQRAMIFRLTLGGIDDLALPIHVNKDGKFLIKVPAPLVASDTGGVVFGEQTFEFKPVGKKGQVVLR
jgi:hypothetical protein